MDQKNARMSFKDTKLSLQLIIEYCETKEDDFMIFQRIFCNFKGSTQAMCMHKTSKSDYIILLQNSKKTIQTAYHIKEHFN